MAFLSFFPATILDGLAPSFPQFPVLLALFAVVVLAAALSFTTIARPRHLKVPRSLTTFARFFYASFLKPHSGDGAVTGQQAALESFYKAQVVSPLANSIHT